MSTRSVVNNNPEVPSSGTIKLSDIKKAFNGKHSSLSEFRGKHPSVPTTGAIGFSFFRGVKAQDPNVTLVAVAGTNVTMDTSGKITGRVTSAAPGSITIDFASMDQNSKYNGSVTYSSTGALPPGGMISSTGVMTLSSLVAAYAASIDIKVTNFYSSCLTFPITFSLTSNPLSSGNTSCAFSFFMSEFAADINPYVTGQNYTGYALSGAMTTYPLKRYQASTKYPCNVMGVGGANWDLGGTTGIATAGLDNIPFQQAFQTVSYWYWAPSTSSHTLLPSTMIDLRCAAPSKVQWASSGGISIMMMIGLGVGKSFNGLARLFQFGPFDIYTRTAPGNGGYQKTFCAFPRGYNGPWFQDWPPDQASWGVSYTVQQINGLNDSKGLAVLTYDNATSTAALYYNGVLKGSQVYSGITPVDFITSNLVIPSWSYDAPIPYISTVGLSGIAVYNSCLVQSQIDYMFNYYTTLTDANFYVNEQLNPNDTKKPYPPEGMTASTTTISGRSYGNGTYTVTSSLDPLIAANKLYSSTVCTPWGAFDGIPHRLQAYLYTDGTKPGCFSMSSGGLNVYTGANAAYTGADAIAIGGAYITTIVPGVSYAGDWVQLACPEAVSLVGYWACNVQYRSASRWVLAGSNNGTTWTTIHFQDTFVAFAPDVYYSLGSNVPAYSYFRYICLNINGWPYWQVDQFMFYIAA